MTLSFYDDLLNKIVEEGEISVSLTDCEAQFFIEDALDELGIVYKKIFPENNRKRTTKTIIYKL